MIIDIIDYINVVYIIYGMMYFVRGTRLVQSGWPIGSVFISIHVQLRVQSVVESVSVQSCLVTRGAKREGTVIVLKPDVC